MVHLFSGLWWLTILTNMSSSMGRIIPYIMENKIHVWNHQPVVDLPINSMVIFHRFLYVYPINCSLIYPGWLSSSQTVKVYQRVNGDLVGGIPTPLKNISQMALLFPMFGQRIQMFQTTNQGWVKTMLIFSEKNHPFFANYFRVPSGYQIFFDPQPHGGFRFVMGVPLVLIQRWFSDFRINHPSY